MDLETRNCPKYDKSRTNTQGRKNNLTQQGVLLIQTLGEFIVLLIKVLALIVESIYRVVLPKNQKAVSGEIVLITGTGHGIGKELALLYASQNATIVCLDINEKTNQNTAQEIFNLGYGKAHAYTCDVTNFEQVEEVAKKIEIEVGTITILINNAGVLHQRSLSNHTVEDIKATINVNLVANIWILKVFLPSMLKNNYGHVVALSSMAGLRGFKNLITYCATKAAVRGMMEAVYMELLADANCKLKFTTIFPYVVDTGLVKAFSVRFPKYFLKVTPKDAALHIMTAQRRDVFEATIPKCHLFLNALVELLPITCIKLIYDFFGVTVYEAP